MRSLSAVVASAALLLALTGLAYAGAATPRGATTAAARCVPATIGGKRTCLRIGARCRASNRQAYLQAGLDCLKSRIRRATPAAVRQGRYIALPPSGVPTRAQALAAFDRTVADLPGVSPRAGTVAPTASGSAALRWMTEYRDELTSVQRELFDDALAPLPGDRTITINADGSLAAAAAGAAAVPAPGPALARPPRAQVAARTPAEFEQIVREAIPRLQAHGLAFRHSVTVSFLDEDKGTTQADAYPLWLVPRRLGNACSVRIYPHAQTSSLAYQRQVIAHELTHCAQYESMSSLGQVGSTPNWVLDGTAEYVAYNVAIEWNGFLPDPAWWRTWLRQSEPGLYTRQYDAVGFWSLLASEGTNVYALIDPVVRAGSGGSSSAAYRAAVQGLNSGFVFDWGSTLAMVSDLGPLWNLAGPGVLRNLPAPILPLGDGATRQLSFAAKGATAVGLNVRADVVQIATSDGVRGRLHTRLDEDVQLAPELNFCARQGGCDCPDGSPSPASGYPPLPQGSATYLGAANPDGAGSITVTGVALDELCRNEPGPGGGGNGTGGGGGGPGLELRKLVGGEPPLLGRITTGTCSFTGTTFVARGSGSGYRFEMRIAGARRPGTYTIPLGNGSTYVRVKGNAGSWTTQTGNLDGPTNGGSAIIKLKPVRRGKRIVTRYRISVGVTPLFSGGKPGLAIIPSGGGLAC